MHRVESRLSLLLGVVLMTGLVAPRVAAQASTEGSLHYAVRHDVTVYHRADTTQPYLTLAMREPVYSLSEEAGWAQVRTGDGARGQVRSEEISDVWIRVSKKTQTLYVYRGDDLVSRLPADLGYNFFSDKEKRGSPDEPDHWRTPDGVFYVVNKNAGSRFHKALVLNYPSREDAVRGRRDGLITDAEFRSIIRADSLFSMPPMNTSLGGWIEIHGNGTGRRANWTQGCIAIKDEAIDGIWDMVHVGTPIVVER